MPAKKSAKAKKTKPEEPAGAPKVFDVAKPGETAADASSRPLIVGHGTIIKQDPMVVDQEPATEPKPVSKTGVSIQPLGEPEEKPTKKNKSVTDIQVLEDAASEDAKESTQEAPELEDVKSDDTPEDSKETKQTKEDTESPAEEETDSDQLESSGGATNALANELVAKKEAEHQAKKEARKAEQTQELIASKKYFVNVHQGPASSSAGQWIILLLLLVVVGVVLAIDAGLIDVGITLPFDLIKN